MKFLLEFVLFDVLIPFVKAAVRSAHPASVLKALGALGGSVKSRDWRAGLDPLLRLIVPAMLVAALVKGCGLGADAPPDGAQGCGQSAQTGSMFVCALVQLSALCPVPGGVEVTFGELNPMFLGQTELVEGGSFRITITSGLSEPDQCSVLVHEWAHAMTWGGPDDGTDHSAYWGVAYAQAYRAGVLGVR